MPTAADDSDERFSHRFEATGTFNYFGSLHPRMTARSTAREEAFRGGAPKSKKRKCSSTTH
jgi:hypothetical protein